MKRRLLKKNSDELWQAIEQCWAEWSTSEDFATLLHNEVWTIPWQLIHFLNVNSYPII